MGRQRLRLPSNDFTDPVLFAMGFRRSRIQISLSLRSPKFNRRGLNAAVPVWSDHRDHVTASDLPTIVSTVRPDSVVAKN